MLHWGTKLSIAGSLAVLPVGFLAEVAQAYPRQSSVAIAQQEGDSYTTLVRRAETAARMMAQQIFDGDILVSEVSITIVGESGSAIVPILAMRVSRDNWRSRPDPQPWSTYFRNARSLLELGTPAVSTPPSAAPATPSSSPVTQPGAAPPASPPVNTPVNIIPPANQTPVNQTSVNQTSVNQTSVNQTTDPPTNPAPVNPTPTIPSPLPEANPAPASETPVLSPTPAPITAPGAIDSPAIDSSAGNASPTP